MYVLEKYFPAKMAEIKQLFPIGILVEVYGDTLAVVGYRATKRHANGKIVDRNIKLIVQRGDMVGTGRTGRETVSPKHCLVVSPC